MPLASDGIGRQRAYVLQQSLVRIKVRSIPVCMHARTRGWLRCCSEDCGKKMDGQHSRFACIGEQRMACDMVRFSCASVSVCVCVCGMCCGLLFIQTMNE